MTRGGSVANLAVDGLAVVDLNGSLANGEAMEGTLQEVIQMPTRSYLAREVWVR